MFQNKINIYEKYNVSLTIIVLSTYSIKVTFFTFSNKILQYKSIQN